MTTALTTANAGAATGRVTGSAAGNPFCQNLRVEYQASAGAQGFCFGTPGNEATTLRPAATNGLHGGLWLHWHIFLLAWEGRS